MDFIIEGRPVGYTTHNRGSRPSASVRRYWDYMSTVRDLAIMAGFQIPLVATKEKMVAVYTIAYFKDGNHPDPENVHKGVKDALFYKKKVNPLLAEHMKKREPYTGDKYTGGSYLPPLYDKEMPRVHVRVVFWDDIQAAVEAQRVKES